MGGADMRFNSGKSVVFAKDLILRRDSAWAPPALRSQGWLR